ncbi:MAG: methyltransferase domain-containing protein [Terriglobales bacterium]|jgi:ubiquinone/menaquinone biosynthesis C-methylase UbiE
MPATKAKTTSQKTRDVQTDYDRLATEYARHLFDELRQKPLDRELLDQFAERVRGRGLVCDLGCGPGQVARYLHKKQIAVCGVDLSPGMIAQARRSNPGIEFTQGDMLALPVADEAWIGIAAFYAIVNFPPADLPIVMHEMWRVLRPGGSLLLSFHIGSEIVQVEDLWGRPVSLDFYFFGVEQVMAELRAAGFEINEIVEREAYAPEIEYQSRRAYIFARKPERTPERVHNVV